MGDLIDRQAAIDSLEIGAEFFRRVLDDTDVVRSDREKFAWGLGLVESFIADMKELPSAESEIIRCKDCKYAHLTYSGDCKFCDKWTDEFGIPEEVYLDGAFFCGYAKRREDE